MRDTKYLHQSIISQAKKSLALRGQGKSYRDALANII